jgi:PST family polysaccharide transporter
LLPFFSVVIPALVFFGVEGERVILLLLGDQWGPAVPLFRVLCLSGVAASLIRVTRWLFLVHGTTARQVRWGMAYLPVMAVASAAGLPWGPFGVACGFTLGNWLMVPSAVTSSLKGSSLTVGDVMAVAARPVGAAVVAALATAAAGLVWPAAIGGPAGALVLARQGVIFSATLAAVWIAIPGGKARLGEAVEMLSESLLRRGRSPNRASARTDSGSADPPA